MPHITLHLTSLRLMQADENLHPLGEEALKRRADLSALGAVLCDLPWFHDVRAQVIPMVLGRDLAPDRWLARLHHEKAMTMGLELLRPRNGARPLGPLARLALAMGYVAHAAWDSRLHPVVHKLAQAETGLSEQRAHLRIEKYQAMLVHPRLAGVPLAEDDAPWNTLARLAEQPELARTLEAVEAASIAARGVGPNPAQWMAWLGGLAQYVALARNRLPFAEGGSVAPEVAYKRWVEAPGYLDHLASAQGRAIAWCNRLCTAFASGDVTDVTLAQLRRAFPDMDLEAAEDPAADQATGHELRAQREVARAWRATRVANHRKDTTALGSNLVQPSRREAPPPMPASLPPPLPLPMAAPPPVPEATPAQGTPLPVMPPPALPPAVPPLTEKAEEESPSSDGESYSDATDDASLVSPMRPSGRVPR